MRDWLISLRARRACHRSSGTYTFILGISTSTHYTSVYNTHQTYTRQEAYHCLLAYRLRPGRYYSGRSRAELSAGCAQVAVGRGQASAAEVSDAQPLRIHGE